LRDQSLQLLTSLLDTSGDGIFAFDPDYTVIGWNRAMEQITDVPRANAIGRSLLEICPELRPSDLQSVLREVTEQRSVSVITDYRTGRFRTSFAPLVDGEKVIGTTASVRLFIAEQVTGEDAYHRLAFHVKNSPLAVIEWDSDFRVSRWSDSAERLFGWKAEEVIGKHVSEWQFVFAEDVEAVEQVTNKQRVGQEIYGLLRNRNYTKDGQVLSCEWYNSVLHDSNGVLVSVLSLVLDITGRKLAEEERAEALAREREARRQAEEADRLKDEFLATLSHELRTPLTSILGWSSMIRSGQVEGDKAARAIETIERNARAQARLIDDLLDVSRIITGNLRLDLHPLNIASIVDTAIDGLRPTADAKGIKLRSIACPGNCLVRGDSNRLRQVVWNLLSNAIKFTPRGGVVTGKLECVDSSVRLTVSDTGEGISPEFLPFVFDRFRQAEGSSSRKQGGLGLGLAVVRHLVELHGGNVGAESAGPGRGSIFTVDLPLADERRDPARAEERKREMDRRNCGGSINFDGLRVLLVEDDDDSRKLLETMLKRYGAEVTSCSSAKLALTCFEERPPDILISDIAMPEQDGYELLRKIRALPSDRGGDVAAIALTGYATRRDRERALAGGYQLHLAKPVEQSELVGAIASIVGRRD
jgi:PAS domain S-box-containing protein